MDMGERLKEIAEYTIRNLVEEDTDVEINVVKSTKNIIIQISVEKASRGRIIGRSGSIIDALKTLFVSVKNNLFPDDRRKISLEIIEEDNYFSRNSR